MHGCEFGFQKMLIDDDMEKQTKKHTPTSDIQLCPKIDLEIRFKIKQISISDFSENEFGYQLYLVTGFHICHNKYFQVLNL